LRVRPASTNLKKNYFTTLQQYRQNRCQTYDQKVFNFYSSNQAEANRIALQNNPELTEKMLLSAKPGSPLALSNTYVANCYPNTSLSGYSQAELVLQAFNYINNENILSSGEIAEFYAMQIQTIQVFASFIKTLTNSEQAIQIFDRFISNPYYGMALTGPSNPRGCKLVVYKPSNPQFATEGGVSSSTRTFKLAVTTVEKNVYNNNRHPFIYKNKTPACNPALPIMFRQVSYNPKTCFRSSDDYFSSADTNLGNLVSGPTVANNGVSASNPGGQPL
jgi:hypothetical protein